jgi:hypothetical protein
MLPARHGARRGEGATSRVMPVATCASNGYDCRSNAITLQSRETLLIAGDCMDQSDIELQLSLRLVKRNGAFDISD